MTDHVKIDNRWSLVLNQSAERNSCYVQPFFVCGAKNSSGKAGKVIVEAAVISKYPQKGCGKYRRTHAQFNGLRLRVAFYEISETFPSLKL
jgi:hypothetical protein